MFAQAVTDSSLVISYSQFDIERKKVWGKKILENKALSAFMVHQPPQSPVDVDQGFISQLPRDSLSS